MITLYHGSNVAVTNPDPRRCRMGTDFSRGFYLTPDMSSARGMAEHAVRRNREGMKTISVFEFDEEAAELQGLRIRKFEEMDLKWLLFSIANRNMDRNAPDHNLDSLYDIVKGYIADDRIRQLADLYERGLVSAEQVLERMMAAPWRVVQYSFHTRVAVRMLKLKEVWHEQ